MRICPTCGNQRREADFTTHRDACRFCTGPDGSTVAAALIKKNKTQQALARSLRELAEKENPALPEVIDAAFARAGGRTAVGEMMMNDLLEVRGSLRPDGSVMSEADRFKAIAANPLRMQKRDHRVIVRMWEFFARITGENDESKRQSRWAEGLDLGSLEEEFRGIILEDLQNADFAEQVLRDMFRLTLSKSSKLREILYDLLIAAPFFGEFVDYSAGKDAIEGELVEGELAEEPPEESPEDPEMPGEPVVEDAPDGDA